MSVHKGALYMEIKEANRSDLSGLLRLYTQLHDNPMPDMNENLFTLWNKILSREDHHVILGTVNGEIVSSCVLTVIPNLTHGQQPYALIENVVTDEGYRKKGYATEVLNYAKEIAQSANCYKIMLLTGSKYESTLKFYEQAGYRKNDKTAFIQWLP